MSTIANNLSSNVVRSDYYAPATSSPSSADSSEEMAATQSSATNSDTVELSEAAKAYLAEQADADATETTGASSTTTDGQSAPTTPASLDKVASDARAWFDQQYDSLGISSALLDGKTAVDFSSQNRATLSAIASNADGLFSADESSAAASELTNRFNAAMAPQVVIARHTGNYANLYQAASDYLDQAGADEEVTAAWQDQKQAVMDGFAAAQRDFGKAPETDNPADPVQALLSTPRVTTSLGADATTDQVAANARSMLDDQEGQARDNGTQLVFDSTRKGQQVDFSNFDNRSLATIVLNQDSSFSTDETRAAKAELDQRTRASLMDSLFPSSSDGSSSTQMLGVLQTYQDMSPEERTVLGVSDSTLNGIVQNYQTMQSLEGALSSGAFGSGLTAPSLSAYI